MKRAALLGLIMGVYIIASVYVVVSLLPPMFGVLGPIGALAITTAFFWPAWFDPETTANWQHRILGRLAVVAAAMPIAAVTAFLTVTAVPSYLTWSEQMHRQMLQQQGLSAQEIETRVAAHRQMPAHSLADGAVATGMVGTLGAAITTAAGAARRRKGSGRS